MLTVAISIAAVTRESTGQSAQIPTPGNTDTFEMDVLGVGGKDVLVH